MNSIETAIVLLRQLRRDADEDSIGRIDVVLHCLEDALGDHQGFMDLARRLAQKRAKCDCIRSDEKLNNALDSVLG